MLSACLLSATPVEHSSWTATSSVSGIKLRGKVYIQNSKEKKKCHGYNHTVVVSYIAVLWEATLSVFELFTVVGYSLFWLFERFILGGREFFFFQSLFYVSAPSNKTLGAPVG